MLGRCLRNSPSLDGFRFEAHRFRMIFKRGFLFYASFNIRLFFYLFTKRGIHTLLSNDLDTLPACALVSRIKKCRLIYDSHELFTEVPELQGRVFVQKVWGWLESLFLPRVDKAITVSHSIAAYYYSRYRKSFAVVRNVPLRNAPSEAYLLPLNFQNRKFVLYQGAVNVGRNIETLMEVISDIDGLAMVVAGTGDLFPHLSMLAQQEAYTGKVYFTGRLSPSLLKGLTRQAWLGVSLEQNIGLSYYYALPNKVFDYIQAEIPVLVAAFPEMKHIVEKWACGSTVDPDNRDAMREAIVQILNDEDNYQTWKMNAKAAARELCWEKEQFILRAVLEG